MISDPPVVLVVEDDGLTRELIQELLVQEGYTVDTAPDGGAGFARIEHGGIDVVVLDLILPKINGLDLCQQVRNRECHDYLPIIMVTGLDSPHYRHAGFAAGADDYVTKPFDGRELVDRVGVWIRTQRRLETTHERVLAALTPRATAAIQTASAEATAAAQQARSAAMAEAQANARATAGAQAQAAVARARANEYRLHL